MVQLHAVSDREQVVDTMIGLTRFVQPSSRDRCRQRQHGALSGAATPRIHPGNHRSDLPDPEKRSTPSA